MKRYLIPTVAVLLVRRNEEEAGKTSLRKKEPK